VKISARVLFHPYELPAIIHRVHDRAYRTWKVDRMEAVLGG
jgi:hypothetical protein